MNTVARVCALLALLTFTISPAKAQFFEKLKEAVEDVLKALEGEEGAGERGASGSTSCSPFSPSSTEGVLFSEDFESGSLRNMWEARPGEGGVVRVVERLPDVPPIPYEGDHALALGRESSGSETVNAVDLCLNLQGLDDVTLLFRIRDEGDETSSNDLILLSEDGERFNEALRLQPTNWADRAYGVVSVNLSHAAEQLELSLTDNFVIRFQQAGYRGFAGRSNYYRDGFFIDDVSISSSLSPQEEVMALVAAKMAVWEQRGEFEKTEDYETRINGDRSEVEAALTQEALREVGERRIEWNSAQSRYDADAEVFTINVEYLGPFNLSVPIDEAEAFDANFAGVQYQNAVYGLGEGNDLTVEYVEVKDPASGKTYIYGEK